MATPEKALKERVKIEWQLRQSNMDSELFLPVLWALSNAISNMENCADVVHSLWGEYLESNEEDAEELTKGVREFSERLDEFAVFLGKSCKLLSSSAVAKPHLLRSSQALDAARKKLVACLDKH